MAVTVTQIEYAPFGKCVEISNGTVSAVITVDCGPRIISYKKVGGTNFFYNDMNGTTYTDDARIGAAYGADRARYYFRGGHRLWCTPERLPETYYPDNDPVMWEEVENGAVFTSVPTPAPSLLQYSFTVTLAEEGTTLYLSQKATNLSDTPFDSAAWGITQCTSGGVCVCPQTLRPDVVPLPDRILALWPYCTMPDSRFVMSERYITLQQDTAATRPFKFGTNNEKAWAGYILGEQMFVKKFEFDANATYPDFGVNFESYTDAGALEVESLGAVVTIGKGESTTLDEVWSIVDVPGIPSRDDADAFADYLDALNI